MFQPLKIACSKQIENFNRIASNNLATSPRTNLKPRQSLIHRASRSNQIVSRINSSSRDKGTSCDLSYSVDNNERYQPKMKILKRRRNGLTVFATIPRLVYYSVSAQHHVENNQKVKARRIIDLSKLEKEKTNIKIQLSNIWCDEYYQS